ncbi:MAG TPA: acyl-CoA thioesterase [Alphaproteobacteria bacterium]|jgi:acyl-CoA thioesterase YciA|nr:acyl-CoA thioesterase [Alphaproteobacteria bacterium]
MSENKPREPAVRTIAMPADTNPSGDIFGGWLLTQMDLAGGTVALLRARGRVVTVAIERMTFHRPVYVGDLVSCYADIVKVGKSSITVQIETVVTRHETGEEFKVTEGTFTYVHVDKNGKPIPVPPS